MKVSIVIPVFNTEKYLAECIESCTSQTYKDFEIIIVNDGSTDNSLEIAKQYQTKYSDLITVLSKKNGGTGSALNMGIDNMKGEWFKWLSADDVLLPNALNDLMSHELPTDCIFYTDYEIINENSETISFFKDKDYMYQKAELYHNFFGNGSTSLIHKGMFAVVGKFNEGMPYNDDYEFWLRWVLKYNLKMKYLPITTLRYRTHSDSLTSTKSISDNEKLVNELRGLYYKYLDSDDIAYLKTLKIPFKRYIGKKFPILRRILRR